MTRFLFLSILVAALTACAHQAVAPGHDALGNAIRVDEKVALFSGNAPGELPDGWTPMVIFKHKKRTAYTLVTDQETTVLHAYSANASSGLLQNVNIDPFPLPWLNWRWKIGRPGQAIVQPATAMEDAPARIILGFDGDKDTLPFADQILFETAKILTGYDFPYATLMYVWDDKLPIGTIAPSSRSSRIRTMVVANGPEGLGRWQEFSRNIVSDFEKAYGEKPGKLIGVGVLTDTDSTGDTVETWYGDIRLLQDRK